jgi:replicative DNA helicase
MTIAALTPMQRTVFALFLMDPPTTESDLESMTEYVRTAVQYIEEAANKPGAVGLATDMELLKSVLIMMESAAELMRINLNALAAVRMRQAQ